MSPEAIVRREDLALPRPYVEPRSATERTLADIWAAALSMDHVGRDDRYIDLGGDSFLATVILGLIEETFAVKLPPALLAGGATIASVADRIDGYLPTPAHRRAE